MDVQLRSLAVLTLLVHPGRPMKTDDLESSMRELEWFHALRAPPGAWLVLRVDGRSFTGLTEKAFEKPFDERFHAAMLQAAQRLMVALDGVFAYTESDEISVLLRRETELFDREVEKLVSVSAGIASAVFSLEIDAEAHFDSRLWLGVTDKQVVDYFRWRQADATRCCLNGWCYWTLRKEGKSAREATAALEGTGFSEKNELLFARGHNFAKLPAWQRLGSALYWARTEKEGMNPKTGETTIATRRSIFVDEELPRGDDYAVFLGALLTRVADSVA
jgi:tRNA(His) guanylyltransferase